MEEFSNTIKIKSNLLLKIQFYLLEKLTVLVNKMLTVDQNFVKHC